MARIMLKVKNVLVKVWVEALNTCYTLNRVYLRPRTTMTPYEIWRGKKPNLKCFHEFGSTCFILNDREKMSKFDVKSDEGIFLGNSLNNLAYKVYNKRTNVSHGSVNVVVDDQGSKSTLTRSDNSNVELCILNKYNKNSNSVSRDDVSPSSSTNLVEEDDPLSSDSFLQQRDLETNQTIDILVREPSKRVWKNYSTFNIIGDPKAGVQI